MRLCAYLTEQTIFQSGPTGKSKMKDFNLYLVLGGLIAAIDYVLQVVICQHLRDKFWSLL